MFEYFTKTKCYTKCKSLTKMTKRRLEALQKRQSVVARNLKKDMAYLIRRDHDYKAYWRAEGLLAEQNMIASYNFLEQFCGCISSNLSLMSKQKECPKECKEAVASLIYAAARFARFPELQALRALFTKRYGTSLESFINEEFVEILRQKSARKKMKLQLMYDIAQEFSIEWNSKSLAQKLLQPPPSQQGQHSQQDDMMGEVKPTPRSVRRRTLKLPAGDEGFGSVERPLKPPPGREKIGRQKNDDIGEATKCRNTISELPKAEPATPTEAAKRHARAVSVGPEMLSGHVHPNLPDFDELAARIAAFKGR